MWLTPVLKSYRSPLMNGKMNGRNRARRVRPRMRNRGGNKFVSLRPTARPIAFKPTIQIDHVFRFEATGGSVDENILYNDLASMWVVATGATTGFTLVAATRLRKLEVWGPMTSSLQPVTVSINWVASAAGAASNSLLVSDTSMGSTTAAHVSTRPPRKSQSAQWQNNLPLGGGSGPDVCFHIIAPQYAVVDVHVSFQLISTGVVGNAITIAAATSGVNYSHVLDSSGSKFLTPVSYPNA